jgi:hypothetical protein
MSLWRRPSWPTPRASTRRARTESSCAASPAGHRGWEDAEDLPARLPEYSALGEANMETLAESLAEGADNVLRFLSLPLAQLDQCIRRGERQRSRSVPDDQPPLVPGLRFAREVDPMRQPELDQHRPAECDVRLARPDGQLARPVVGQQQEQIFGDEHRPDDNQAHRRLHRMRSASSPPSGLPVGRRASRSAPTRAGGSTRPRGRCLRACARGRRRPGSCPGAA